MFAKYLLIFFVSMVPLVELRGSIVMAVGMDLDYWTSLAVCVVGNMLPVPLIYFFARKVLHWGADKKYFGKFFSYCLEKGEAAGHRLYIIRKMLGNGNPAEITEQLIAMLEKTENNKEFVAKIRAWNSAYEKDGFTTGKTFNK